ncbi:MAG: hypothetical protein LV481_07345 [Methylacidiphilales bacterium]|nr:hypothetical protein [Candidatus Methylacidiphilales bacterium]
MPHYRVELHSHCKGDPVDTYLTHSIFDHIDQAKKVGLDAIAVTWHQKACVHPEAEAYARERGILLISGMEAEINHRHLVVLNVSETELSGKPSWDEVRALRARRPDVLVIAPHPFYPHPSCLGGEMTLNSDCIDAVEWCRLHIHWLPVRVNPNLRAARWAHRHGKPLLACSDAHALTTIGTNASTLQADALTPAALFEAIRAGRISFHRRSLDFVSLVYETSLAIASQPKHLQRWAAAKVSTRRT